MNSTCHVARAAWLRDAMVREQVQHQTNGQCFRVQRTVRCTEGKFRVERGGVINDDRIGDGVTGDKLNAMGGSPSSTTSATNCGSMTIEISS